MPSSDLVVDVAIYIMTKGECDVLPEMSGSLRELPDLCVYYPYTTIFPESPLIRLIFAVGKMH